VLLPQAEKGFGHLSGRMMRCRPLRCMNRCGSDSSKGFLKLIRARRVAVYAAKILDDTLVLEQGSQTGKAQWVGEDTALSAGKCNG